MANPLIHRPPLFFNDHKAAATDPAVCAMRMDSPVVNGRKIEGKWKLFFDADLIRLGKATPLELFNLANDPKEETDLSGIPEWKPFILWMSQQAERHRNSGGHRLTSLGQSHLFHFNLRSLDKGMLTRQIPSGIQLHGKSGNHLLSVKINAAREGKLLDPFKMVINENGLGIKGGGAPSVNDGEALLIEFEQDVIVESIAIKAGNGVCGGFYQMGSRAPLAVYCVDGDNDAKEQHGLLSDLGVLKAGETLRLESRPHLGVESEGDWTVQGFTVRPVADIP